MAHPPARVIACDIVLGLAQEHPYEDDITFNIAFLDRLLDLRSLAEREAACTARAHNDQLRR